MLDWARKGLWRYGGSRKILGQKDGLDQMRPMVGQYFDMACCCCNPYIIGVLSLPPSSIAPNITSEVINLKEEDTSEEDGTDSSWDYVTSMIDPNTNSTVEGRWLVRKIDVWEIRIWKVLMSGYPSDIVPSVQTMWLSVGPAFLDGGTWVTRSRPAWQGHEEIGWVGYGRPYSNIFFYEEDQAYSKKFSISRVVSNSYDGGFWYSYFEE